jgi:xylan 1,4-beta-xylosidase
MPRKIMTDARADWEQRIYQRRTEDADPTPTLPAPTGVRAEPAVGYVRLSWDAVPGAAGYLIERDDVLVGHGGSDVAAVAGSPFADTGLPDGVDYHYRIGAVAGAEHPVQAWSETVSAQTLHGPAQDATVDVDTNTVTGTLERVWRMVGSERLTQLTFGDDGHGNDIGAEFAEALRRAHDDLGVTHVRAHAVLHDDNQVVTDDLKFDFDRIDTQYDQILALGVKPVVELSFMPAALARDPEETVFGYRGIISPPRDWARWWELVRELAAHLVDRYGIDEVADWGFEVWNEPNLIVFWSGTQEEYLRLYDTTADAIKSVDPRLRVGGPSTAAGEWVEALVRHAAENNVPLDFLTTHTYGNLPLDTHPTLHRHGFDNVPVWWTEWGVGSTHFGPIHDSVAGAPFVLSGFHDAQGRVDRLAYWVISDHFEELGRPQRLFHNGFGLLSVGNLRKPRYWAAHLAAHQGDHVLATRAHEVQAWATKHDDGTIDILLWNGTINADLMRGDPRLGRHLKVTVNGLNERPYKAKLARVDERHSNIVAAWPPDVDWPDDALWARLRGEDHLHEQELPDVTPHDGVARFGLDLPMPGVARIRLKEENA